MTVGDDDDDDEPVTLTATAADLTEGTDETLTVTDHRADISTTAAADGSGFRVIIAAPSPVTKWAKVGKNQVKVKVLRRDGIASQWGNYSSIKVALRQRNEKGDGDDHPGQTDPDAVPPDLYSLAIADGDANQLGTLSLERVKTDSLAFGDITVAASNPGGTAATTVSDGANATTNIIAYKRRSRSGKYDELEFRFNIANTAAAPPAENANEEDLKKVYAQVTFFVGGDAVGDPLNSYDTETSIYPENPSISSDKVGDGKFIKIDRTKPFNDIISSLSYEVSKEGNIVESDINVGIGDEIKIDAEVDGVFREASVALQIISTDSVAVDSGGQYIVNPGPTTIPAVP